MKLELILSTGRTVYATRNDDVLMFESPLHNFKRITEAEILECRAAIEALTGWKLGEDTRRELIFHQGENN